MKEEGRCTKTFKVPHGDGIQGDPLGAVTKNGVNEATDSVGWVILPKRVRCAGKRKKELRQNNLFKI